MLDLLDPLRGLSEALVGQVLPGSEGRLYPLRELIGEGGQGWVFRATWNGSVDVVVKVLRPDVASADSLGRFRREADVLRMLSQQPSPNPHVVRFFDHAYARVRVATQGPWWDVPFTVLEYVDGETLERALARAQPSGVGLERARRILRHVVLALHDVHARGVIHRDLKPSNILLTSAGGREIAKVTDFGLAKLLAPGLERTTHLAGATLGYAPPEQFEDGNRRVASATDVFSLAAIFYEMVTGLPAFPINPNAHPLLVIVRILEEARPALARVRDRLPRELAERPDVVAAVDIELARALSPDPSDRHRTVTELLDSVERALASMSAAPSLPVNRGSSEVIVRSSHPPDFGMAATMHADAPVAGSMSSTAQMADGILPANRRVAEASTLEWRCITRLPSPDTLCAIAARANGGRAVGVGRAVWQWRKGAWTPLDLPAGVRPESIHAIAWHGDRLVLAASGPIVCTLEDEAGPMVWRVGSPDLVFYAAFADAEGIVLAGERATHAGPLGVVAEMPHSGPNGLRLVDVPRCGPLRGVTRLPAGILACGDAGAVVLVAPGQSPRLTSACPAPLHALLAMTDGTAIAVGGGGFVFRLWSTLDAQLETIQTTRDLFALSRGPEGAPWCAGDAGRVLRRDAQGWVRMGVRGADARVRALHASGHRVLAFCEDGSVFEGVAG
jgi:serine/threonine-protein kinase